MRYEHFAYTIGVSATVIQLQFYTVWVERHFSARECTTVQCTMYMRHTNAAIQIIIIDSRMLSIFSFILKIKTSNMLRLLVTDCYLIGISLS